MNKIEIDINEVINLTDKFKTPREIGELLGVDESLIRLRLKSIGKKPYRKITRKNKGLLNKIEHLIKEGKTNQQIANELKICASTIRRYTYDLGFDTNSVKKKSLTNIDIKLTQEQWEVLYGSLLGDMSLELNWKNVRPVISQGGAQEDYFDYKCNIFKNLIGKINKKEYKDKRSNKKYRKCVVKFLTNPIYTALKKELYPNGIKRLTRNWLDKITPRGLAFWFMDDGTNAGTIATNCFTKSECELIVNWLYTKWGIESTLQKSVNNGNIQYLVYIRKKSRPIFYNLTHIYFIPSMLYKISNWNPKKLCELRENP